MNDYQGITAVVNGLGKSGCSAAKFLLARGAHVIGIDDNLDTLSSHDTIQTLKSQGLRTEKSWDCAQTPAVKLIVNSPGIPSTHPTVVKGKERNIEVIGEMELAFRSVNSRCIGITGTNGKTTVTLLLEHILTSCGKKAKAVGNIGTPITSEIDEEKYDFFVVELSSFQLETLTSKSLDCAAILNITPDHLDRYATMDDYIAAKLKVLEIIKDQGVCFVHEDIETRSEYEKAVRFGFQPSSPLRMHSNVFYWQEMKTLPLPPEMTRLPCHDQENLLAAYGICKYLDIGDSEYLHAVASFKKPQHRIEFVGKIHEVKYYNDSKGTNVDAVVKAVDAMDGQVILIAGGVDKGYPFTSWLQKFAGKVQCICAIGEAAKKIEGELGSKIPVALCRDLEEAVLKAKDAALPGSNVLLSPGCSSFDMFRDYAHRGDEFKRIVSRFLL